MWAVASHGVWAPMAGRDNQVVSQARNAWLSDCNAPCLWNCRLRDGYPRRSLGFVVGSTNGFLERVFSVFRRCLATSQGKTFLWSGRWRYPSASGGLLLHERDAHTSNFVFWRAPLSSVYPFMVLSSDGVRSQYLIQSRIPWEHDPLSYKWLGSCRSWIAVVIIFFSISYHLVWTFCVELCSPDGRSNQQRSPLWHRVYEIMIEGYLLPTQS